MSRGGVLAASFDVSLSDFANLGATCNAKVQEIAIQLVGQDLGTAQPTVGLAYDGTSSVRSCQPDIDDIVEGIGPDATSFGSITMFRTPGRVLAPTAGLNAFGQSNQTLIGLPLASQYTVIIDPRARPERVDQLGQPRRREDPVPLRLPGLLPRRPVPLSLENREMSHASKRGVHSKRGAFRIFGVVMPVTLAGMSGCGGGGTSNSQACDGGPCSALDGGDDAFDEPG